MAWRLNRIPLEAVLLVCVLFAGFAVRATNQALEARSIESAPNGEVGVLPDGQVLHVLSLGFERVVADLFWIRTIYYIGDENASVAKWPAAERLSDLVTDVDPHFDSAYVVMASVLGQLRSDPDAAIRVLEKGTANSDYWRIHFLLGFQYFLEKHDYARGAECLQRAFDLGGPAYLQFLITRLYSSAGDPNTAMQFIAARLQTEEQPPVRELLEKRYVALWINRDLHAIDTAIESYKAKHKRAPKDVRELVRTGFLESLPRDPKGGEYAIFADGKAGTELAYENLELKLPRGGSR